MIIRKKLTQDQMADIAALIGEWYYAWKERITDNQTPHRLGQAREDLKKRLQEETED